MSESTRPGLADVLRAALDQQLAGLHVAMPGTISSYDHTTQRATVTVAVRSWYKDPATDAITLEAIPPIANVPVLFPSGSGGALTFPLAQGDPVLLVFADRSLDEWLAQGGGDVAPQARRRHALTDAVAIPAPRSFASPLPGSALDASAVVLSGSTVKLGDSSATAALALATKVAAELGRLKSLFDAWTPVAGDGGAALKAAWTVLSAAGWPADTGANKVRGV